LFARSDIWTTSASACGRCSVTHSAARGTCMRYLSNNSNCHLHASEWHGTDLVQAMTLNVPQDVCDDARGCQPWSYAATVSHVRRRTGAHNGLLAQGLPASTVPASRRPGRTLRAQGPHLPRSSSMRRSRAARAEHGAQGRPRRAPCRRGCRPRTPLWTRRWTLRGTRPRRSSPNRRGRRLVLAC
jgi:hypothetical protein